MSKKTVRKNTTRKKVGRGEAIWKVQITRSNPRWLFQRPTASALTRPRKQKGGGVQGLPRRGEKGSRVWHVQPVWQPRSNCRGFNRLSSCQCEHVVGQKKINICSSILENELWLVWARVHSLIRADSWKRGQREGGRRIFRGLSILPPPLPRPHENDWLTWI